MNDFLADVDEAAEPLWDAEPYDPSVEHDYFREDWWAGYGGELYDRSLDADDD